MTRVQWNYLGDAAIAFCFGIVVAGGGVIIAEAVYRLLGGA